MTDEQYRELVPKRICEYEKNNEIVTVLYFKKPTFIEKIFFRTLVNKPYKIDLDEIGSFIWEQINALNSIYEITKLAKDRFGDKIEPAENRVIQFIRQMHSTKLIMLFEKTSNL